MGHHSGIVPPPAESDQCLMSLAAPGNDFGETRRLWRPELAGTSEVSTVRVSALPLCSLKPSSGPLSASQAVPLMLHTQHSAFFPLLSASTLLSCYRRSLGLRGCLDWGAVIQQRLTECRLQRAPAHAGLWGCSGGKKLALESAGCQEDPTVPGSGST